MIHEPLSKLTLRRPDIWRRGLDLAAATTGMIYLPKLPGADGVIWACYGNPSYPATPPPPPRIKTPEELAEEEAERVRKEIASIESEIAQINGDIHGHQKKLAELRQRRRELKQRKATLLASPRVFVPDGAMEWLLHEVGHFVAADPIERLLPNYGLTASEHGHDGEREWQAWAFEEIVLAPWGPSRLFAPPTQRDGAAFSKNGPIAAMHMRHVERRIAELGIAIEPWRIVWGEWVRWSSPSGCKAQP